jgi:hypothetical protein
VLYAHFLGLIGANFADDVPEFHLSCVSVSECAYEHASKSVFMNVCEYVDGRNYMT